MEDEEKEAGHRSGGGATKYHQRPDGACDAGKPVQIIVSPKDDQVSKVGTGTRKRVLGHNKNCWKKKAPRKALNVVTGRNSRGWGLSIVTQGCAGRPRTHLIERGERKGTVGGGSALQKRDGHNRDWQNGSGHGEGKP